jgi:hypothetical protein
MPEFTINVCRQAHKIQVYCLAKSFWIAGGEYLGEQLRTRGSTAGKAVMAWRRAAELRESGRDTEAAEKLLQVLERTQKVFEYDLADLEKRE